MATLTAVGARSGVQPKSFHVGVQAAYMEWSCPAGLSAGDIVLMGKIPNNSRVLGIWRKAGAGAGNDFTHQIGYDSTLSAFASTLSGVAAGTGAWITTNVPQMISLSDAAVPQWATVKMQVTGVVSSTALGAMSLTVLFNRDFDS